MLYGGRNIVGGAQFCRGFNVAHKSWLQSFIKIGFITHKVVSLAQANYLNNKYGWKRTEFELVVESNKHRDYYR